jgi:uncharacterized protein (TIGR03435 family)
MWKGLLRTRFLRQALATGSLITKCKIFRFWEGRGRKEMDFETGRGQLKARNIPMPYLTRYLSRRLGPVVVDKTGLGGKYHFALT